MAWSEEDWLIIDSVLNDIAKSLRRIKQERRKLEQHRQHKEETQLVFSSAITESSGSSLEGKEGTKSAP